MQKYKVALIVTREDFPEVDLKIELDAADRDSVSKNPVIVAAMDQLDKALGGIEGDMDYSMMRILR